MRALFKPNTRQILEKTLTPKFKRDSDKWNDFLNSIDDTVLWFPDGGKRFHDLRFFSYADNPVAPNPSLCIYTDHLPNEILHLLIVHRRFEFDFHNVIVEDVIHLDADWDYKFKYDFVHPNHRSIMAAYYGDEEFYFPQHEPKSGIEKILKPKSADQASETVRQDFFRDLVEKVFLLKVRFEFETDDMEEHDFET